MSPSLRGLRRLYVARIIGAALLLLASGCDSRDSLDHPAVTAPTASAAAAEAEPQIRVFCSGCHAFPDPSLFPQGSWIREVQRGFDFYYKSDRTDLNPPRMEQAIEWFRERAPPSLEIPPAHTGESPSPVQFER